MKQCEWSRRALSHPHPRWSPVPTTENTKVTHLRASKRSPSTTASSYDPPPPFSPERPKFLQDRAPRALRLARISPTLRPPRRLRVPDEPTHLSCAQVVEGSRHPWVYQPGLGVTPAGPAPPFAQTKAAALDANGSGSRTPQHPRPPAPRGREHPRVGASLLGARHPGNGRDVRAHLPTRFPRSAHPYRARVPAPGGTPLWGGGAGAPTEEPGVRSLGSPQRRARSAPRAPREAPGPRGGTALSPTPGRPAARADARGQAREAGAARILPW